MILKQKKYLPMKTQCFMVVAIALALTVQSCQPQDSASMTDAEKTAVADAAKAAVKNVIDMSNKMDFQGALKSYSSEADARFIENGHLYSSLDEIKNSYEQLAPMLDKIENMPDRWDVLVLSKDAVAITIPFHFTVKAKGRDPHNAQAVWTGIVQKKNGQWVITQAHESWLNASETMAAIEPKAN
jgi:hypothetical protein